MAPDTDRRLAAVLGELRELLEVTDDLAPSARDALSDAAAEIQSALDADEESGSQLAGIRERIERFEGDHPRITEVVRRLVDQLSEMGI